MTPESLRDRRRGRLAFLLSFSSFFMFPAIPLGQTVGLTIPYVLAALLAVVWIRRFTTSEWQPFAWAMAPLVISGAYVLLVGRALAPDVVPKAIVLMAMTLLVLIPTRHLFRAGHGEQLILGAAFAILVHAALGAYQVLAFERAEFPFAAVMRTNPSMAMTADGMETYVAWVRRPFGLFAEPSAMAACVGPWLVLISTALFTRPAGGGVRRHRAVLAVALVSGLALVVVSQSGLAVPIAAASAAPALRAAFASRRAAPARLAALLVSVGIVCASAVWLTGNAASRFDMAQNESWRLRLGSLELALAALESGDDLLVGIGPGQSIAHLRSTSMRDRAPGGVTAIWSVTLTYAIETGLVGVLCMLVLGGVMALSILDSRAPLPGAACAAVWVIGLLVGTSYPQQPALWTAMAALLSWRTIAEDLRAVTGRPEPVCVPGGAAVAAGAAR